jgi:hypothetical protein
MKKLGIRRLDATMSLLHTEILTLYNTHTDDDQLTIINISSFLSVLLYRVTQLSRAFGSLCGF